MSTEDLYEIALSVPYHFAESQIAESHTVRH